MMALLRITKEIIKKYDIILQNSLPLFRNGVITCPKLADKNKQIFCFLFFFYVNILFYEYIIFVQIISILLKS